MARNELVSYFSDDEIRTIHNLSLEYAIKKYEQNDESYQEFYEDKYYHAKNLLGSSNMSYLNENQIKEYLQNEKDKYEKNIESNKPIMELYGNIVENILFRGMNDDFNQIDRINYIFDYCAETLSYSEEWFDYYNQTPPKDGFDFDFKKTTPVDTDIEGLLVQGQGVCDDFCNLIQYLGKKAGLDIGKMFVNYKDQRHTINTFTIDGKKSLIDITRVVRGDMKKEQCFLVSEDTLKKFGLYNFDNNTTTVDIENENYEPKYNISEIVKLVNSIKPRDSYIKQKTEYQK